MFTSLPKEQVLEFFSTFARKSHAKIGQKVNESITLLKGPLTRHDLPMPNNMEPQLRKLGLPTELNQGVLCLRQDHVVCTPGTVLTADQAHILVLIF